MNRKFLFLAAAAMAFAAVSCSKRENPDSDGNDAPDVYEIRCSVALADAYFCGTGADEAGNVLDYDMYYLSLAGSGVTMTGSGYAGIGSAVLIDMNTPMTGGNPMIISDGHYSKVSESEASDYVFYLGQLNSDNTINPTYVYYRPDERTSGRYYPVNGGSLSIGTNGGNRTVSASMETEIGTFVFSYRGADFTYTDITDDDDDDNPSVGTEISLDNLTTGYAVWCGQPFDGSYGTGYSDWFLYVGAKPFSIEDVSASYLQIELITEVSATTVVPDGKYSFLDFTTAESLTPGSMLGGYLDEDYYCWGTWYFGDSDEEYFGATSGSATIKYADGSYDIDFEMEDSSISPAVAASGHFKAKLEYLDGSEEESVQLASLSKGRLHRAMLPTVRRHRISRSGSSEVKGLLKSYSRK